MLIHRLAWYAETCVRSNVESCETGIKDEVLGFLERMNTATNVTNRCPNPCMTMPCRNGGTCRQTSADSYVCECPQNLTGKYCEIGGWLCIWLVTRILEEVDFNCLNVVDGFCRCRVRHDGCADVHGASEGRHHRWIARCV